VDNRGKSVICSKFRGNADLKGDGRVVVMWDKTILADSVDVAFLLSHRMREHNYATLNSSITDEKHRIALSRNFESNLF
jgi:hypothetical protein